eukprot:COSAG04_NODE_13152_length_618_cov_0.926782_1_plen_58_part_10
MARMKAREAVGAAWLLYVHVAWLSSVLRGDGGSGSGAGSITGVLRPLSSVLRGGDGGS